jgi:hypothetical protein
MQKKSPSLIRAELKYLLYQFAKESDSPGQDLQEILREVINELHDDVMQATSKQSGGLRLVSTAAH